jgi:MoxR-like ATPase
MDPVEPVPGEPAAVATLTDGQRALVVADYHAGLESALRSRGLEAASRAEERLEHLLELLADTDTDRVVFLGELAHWIGRPAGRELEEIKTLIDAREETEQLARFRVSGPPGVGKTTLAEDIAARRRAPYVEVQLTASMRESDLIGAPKLVGQETYWADGPITRALLCSQERETVLVLDEVNRANPRAKTALMPVLDYRARVRIKARGDEIVQGDPENLIVVATMNEGAEFQTYDLDPAEKRRLGNHWEIPYLGLEDVGAEAELVARESSIGGSLARVLVSAANAVRERALDPDDRVVTKGIAASQLVRWAQTIKAYEATGGAEPFERAAESAVVQAVYDDREAQEAVREILQEAVAGLRREVVA